MVSYPVLSATWSLAVGGSGTSVVVRLPELPLLHTKTFYTPVLVDDDRGERGDERGNGPPG